MFNVQQTDVITNSKIFFQGKCVKVNSHTMQLKPSGSQYITVQAINPCKSSKFEFLSFAVTFEIYWRFSNPLLGSKSQAFGVTKPQKQTCPVHLLYFQIPRNNECKD